MCTNEIDYKKLENKTVQIEEFLGKETALQILQDSFEMYREYFKN